MARTRFWEKSSFSQSGGKPQSLLNKQFVNDCDAAVAIFWSRFGTKTDAYGSGTEEEISIMLDSGKQVFMYFSDKPLPLSEHKPEEYDRIREFKAKYKDKGIYYTYKTDTEFEELFFSHLCLFFLGEISAEQAKLKRCFLRQI